MEYEQAVGGGYINVCILRLTRDVRTETKDTKTHMLPSTNKQKKTAANEVQVTSFISSPAKAFPPLFLTLYCSN